MLHVRGVFGRKVAGAGAGTASSGPSELERSLKRAPLSADLIALEPRMVFDGAGVATIHAVSEASKTAPTAPADADHGTDDGAEQALDAALSAALSADTAPVAAAPAAPREVVFVDARVAQEGGLADRLRQDPTREVVIVGADENGIEAVSRWLEAQQGEVSALHIVGHGSEGAATLGASTIDTAALAANDTALRGWQAHLTAEADILLYGCDTGAGEKGAAFTAALAAATGADVAASTDRTGGASGADWDLERRTGAIEADVLTAETWLHDLADAANATLPTDPVAAAAAASKALGGVDVSGLKIWMDASTLSGDAGSSVTAWTNRANATDAGAPAATLANATNNAAPTLERDSRGNYVQMNGSSIFTFGRQTWFDGESTVFVVIDGDDFRAGSSGVYHVIGNMAVAGSRISIERGTSAASGRLAIRNANWSGDSVTASATAAGLVLSDRGLDEQIVSARFAGAGENWTIQGRTTLSGKENFGEETGQANHAGTGDLSIGTTYARYGFAGKIREVVVFSRAMNDAEMRSVEAALAQKWQLQQSATFFDPADPQAGRNDVAVVSRSDRTGHAVATSGSLTIDATRFMADSGNAIGFAHDGGALGFAAPRTGESQRYLERTWSIDVSGLSGRAKLSFDGLTGVADADVGKLHLIWRASANDAWSLLATGEPAKINGAVVFDGVLVNDGTADFPHSLRDGFLSIGYFPDAIHVQLVGDTGASASDLRTTDPTVKVTGFDAGRYSIHIKQPGGLWAPLSYTAAGGAITFDGHVDTTVPRQNFMLQLRDRTSGADVGPTVAFSFFLEPPGGIAVSVAAPPESLSNLSPSPPRTLVVGNDVYVGEIVANTMTVSELRVAQVLADDSRGPFTYELVDANGQVVPSTGPYSIDRFSGWISIAKGRTTDYEVVADRETTLRVRVSNGVEAQTEVFNFKLQDRNDLPSVRLSVAGASSADVTNAKNFTVTFATSRPTAPAGATVVVDVTDEDKTADGQSDRYYGTLVLSGEGGTFSLSPGETAPSGVVLGDLGTGTLRISGVLQDIKSALGKVIWTAGDTQRYGYGFTADFTDYGNSAGGGSNLRSVTPVVWIETNQVPQLIVPQGQTDLAIVVDQGDFASASNNNTRGVLLSQLLSIGGNVRVAQGDIAALAVAVTGTASSGGRWWYSLDGRTWTDIKGTGSDAVSATSALVLPTSALMYFQSSDGSPSGLAGGADALTFRLLDRSVPGLDPQSIPANGARINTQDAAFAGTSTQKALLSDASGRLTPQLNQRPTISATSLPIVETSQSPVLAPTPPSTVPTGAVVGVTALDLWRRAVTDGDQPASGGLAVTGVSGNTGNGEDDGRWWVSTSNGNTWLRLQSASDSAAFLFNATDGVRFFYEAPAAGIVGTPSLTIRAWDPLGQGGTGSGNLWANGVGSLAPVNISSLVNLANGPFSDAVTANVAGATPPVLPANLSVTVPQVVGGVTVKSILERLFPNGVPTGVKGIAVVNTAGAVDPRLVFTLADNRDTAGVAPYVPNAFPDGRFTLLDSNGDETRILSSGTYTIRLWNGMVYSPGFYNGDGTTSDMTEAQRMQWNWATQYALSEQTATLTITPASELTRERPVIDPTKIYTPSANSQPTPVEISLNPVATGPFALRPQAQTMVDSPASWLQGRRVADIMRNATEAGIGYPAASVLAADRGASLGIAVTGFSNRIQVLTGDGSTSQTFDAKLFWRVGGGAGTWQEISATGVSDTNALLLDRNAELLYLVQNGAVGISPQVLSQVVSFRAWDMTFPATGVTWQASATGSPSYFDTTRDLRSVATGDPRTDSSRVGAFSAETGRLSQWIVPENTPVIVTTPNGQVLTAQYDEPVDAATSMAVAKLFDGATVRMGVNASESVGQRVTGFEITVNRGSSAVALSRNELIVIDGLSIPLTGNTAITGSTSGLIYRVVVSADGATATITASVPSGGAGMDRTNFQALLNEAGYRNVSDDPTGSTSSMTRTVILRNIRDVDGFTGDATSTQANVAQLTTTLTVVPTADLPRAAFPQGAATVIEGAGARILSPVTVTDPDSTTVFRAVVTLTAGQGRPLTAHDVLSLTLPAELASKMTVTVKSTDGERELTISSANASQISLADIKAALDLVQYSYGGDAKVGERSVAVTLFDSTSTDSKKVPGIAVSRTIAVTNVSDAPVAVNSAVSATEDRVYTFTAADFPFTDPDQFGAVAATKDTLAAVIVESVPTQGELRLYRADGSHTVVGRGLSVGVAAIDAGLFRYAPPADWNGQTGFAFKVQDSGTTANNGRNVSENAATVTVTVEPRDDAPTSADRRETLLEGATKTLRENDFAFSDARDGTAANSFSAVVISGIGGRGQLTFNGTAYTSASQLPAGGLVVTSADLAAGRLTWTATAANDANWPGTGALPATAYGDFVFKVKDTGRDTAGHENLSGPYTYAFDLRNVADRPTAGGGNASVQDDGVYRFPSDRALAETLFGFTDPIDRQNGGLPDFANVLKSVRITGLPQHGTLTYDGTTYGTGQGQTLLPQGGLEIAVANLSRLVYTPAKDLNFRASDTFTYTLIDTGSPSDGGQVESDGATFTFSITAVNDAPVLGGGQAVSYTENAQPVPVLPALTVSDPDNTQLTGATVSIASGYVQGQDRLAFANTSRITGSWDPATGVLRLSGTASVADYQNALRSVTYRNTSDDPSTVARSIVATVTDAGNQGTGAGAVSAPLTVTLTVVAVNDAPVARDDSGFAATSGVAKRFTVSDLTANDTDAESPSSALVVEAVQAADKGTVTLKADGSIEFVPTAPYAGTATFQYRVKDPQGELSNWATVSMTVSNATLTVAPDRADVDENNSISVPASGVLANDSVQPATIGLSVAGVRDATTPTFSPVAPGNPATVQGTYGTLTLHSDGRYTYTANTAAANALVAGQRVNDVFTYQAENTSKVTRDTTLTITVTGLNDSATISGTATGTVHEKGGVNNGTSNGATTASGTVTVNDVDTGQNRFQDVPATSLVGAYGSFTFDARTGAWTYTLDEAKADKLPAGRSPTERLVVTSLDGTAVEDIVVTVVGANDAAVIGDPPSNAVREDTDVTAGGLLVASGSLSITDADTAATPTQAAFLPTVAGATGNLGTLTLDANGGYRYSVPNAAVQGLGDGETHRDTFTVTSVDGTTKTVTFVINGVNDGPIVAGTASVTTAEDTPVTVPVGATDVDGDTLSYAVKPGSGPSHGTVTFDQGLGQYVYSPNRDFHGTDGFTIVVTDGKGGIAEQSVSVTVTPVNDAPTGLPVILGDASINGVLVADTGRIADADGLGPFSYQWLRNGQSISGATADRYTIVSADIGQAISVAVSFVDGDGTTETVVSASVLPTSASVVPVVSAFRASQAAFDLSTDIDGLSVTEAVADERLAALRPFEVLSGGRISSVFALGAQGQILGAGVTGAVGAGGAATERFEFILVDRGTVVELRVDFVSESERRRLEIGPEFQVIVRDAREAGRLIDTVGASAFFAKTLASTTVVVELRAPDGSLIRQEMILHSEGASIEVERPAQRIQSSAPLFRDMLQAELEQPYQSTKTLVALVDG